MSESNLDKHAEPTPASSPDELIKDLDVSLSETDQESIVGGKAERLYMTVKLTDGTISK